MRRITAFLFLFLCLLSPGLFCQEAATIPEGLRKPERSEAPRYPQDLVIGELGPGKAPESSFLFAEELLDALAAGSKTAPVFTDSAPALTESIIEEIVSIEPRTYHLGGGRVEVDGSVSFMVRFLGAAESITGELYLRRDDSGAVKTSGETSESEVPAEELSPSLPEPAAPPLQAETAAPPSVRWILDDLILEGKQLLADIEDSYRFDFSPYERFY